MSSSHPLISVSDLAGLTRTDLVILDCRFELADPAAGARLFDGGHLPGAYYADLNRQLSGEVTKDTGRHPLPCREAFAEQLGRWGIDPDTSVVVYDEGPGAFASRAWWMMKWMGHQSVRLLDGGLNAWQAAGLEVSQQRDAVTEKKPYPAQAPRAETITAAALLDHLENESTTLIDARAPARFLGLAEPIDSVAGHIPGALNRPFQDNLSANGQFKTAAQLHHEWGELLTGAPPIVMCGSGVTACHHLIALEVAGLPGGKLYSGSWSEWIRDPARPVVCQV